MSNQYSNQMKKYYSVLIVLALFSVSCKKDKPTEEPTSEAYDLRDGLWWVNEGAFNGNNASIDVVTADGRIAKDAFRQSNGSGLGDILQRVNVIGDKAVAVVNGSNQVVIMNTADMKVIRVIPDLDYPRDAIIVDDVIYIAQGALAGKVGKYNVGTGALLDEVNVGQGPERLLENNGQLWVLNSGGWAVDNTISIVDLGAFSVLQNIVVHDRPLDIEFDEISNKVMVLCSGDAVGFDFSYFELADQGVHPKSIAWSKTRSELYLANQGIDVFDGQGNENCNGCWTGDAYTVDADNDGNVWITSTPDFSSDGIMSKVNASDWSTVASYSSGIGTSAVVDPR
jgi:hypothetical protein